MTVVNRLCASSSTGSVEPSAVRTTTWIFDAVDGSFDVVLFEDESNELTVIQNVILSVFDLSGSASLRVGGPSHLFDLDVVCSELSSDLHDWFCSILIIYTKRGAL